VEVRVSKHALDCFPREPRLVEKPDRVTGGDEISVVLLGVGRDEDHVGQWPALDDVESLPFERQAGRRTERGVVVDDEASQAHGA
jgi:hypothetical protein